MRVNSYETIQFKNQKIEVENVSFTPPPKKNSLITAYLPNEFSKELNQIQQKQINNELGSPWLWLPLEQRIFIWGRSNTGWFERREKNAH
jgi:hypothetical protein